MPGGKGGRLLLQEWIKLSADASALSDMLASSPPAKEALMAPCAAQVFNNLTQDQFNCLAAKAKAAGLPISGNSGTVSKLGAKVTWTYDPTAQQLTIQVLQTPIFMGCGDVNSKIHGIVETCTG
jgi:hypothetical protein